jgi:hypothetical protein
MEVEMKNLEVIKEARTIRVDHLDVIMKRLQAHNRRAVKLGFPPATLKLLDDSVVKMRILFDGRHVSAGGAYDHLPAKQVYFVADAELEYTIPVIDGWELISVFNLEGAPLIKDSDGNPVLDDDGNPTYGDRIVFTSTVPGKELPAKYLDKHEIHCDHCGHNRFRTRSMLMRDVANGMEKEVGSTCVKDFFGHDPKNLTWISYFNFEGLCEDSVDFYAGGGGAYDMDTHGLMAYTALAIRQFGWTSKGDAYGDPTKTSTADDVFMLMDPPMNFNGEVMPTDDDRKLALDTIKHFSELDPGTNDYLVNCCKVVKLGYVPHKMVGVACSMVATYRRHVQSELEKKDYPESEFVGEVGDKVEANVKCLFFTEVSSDWGTSEFYIFINEETGEVFKTYYGGVKWQVNQGDTCKIKGTVKRHNTDSNGRKATMLTRVNATDVVEGE